MSDGNGARAERCERSNHLAPKKSARDCAHFRCNVHNYKSYGRRRQRGHNLAPCTTRTARYNDVAKCERCQLLEWSRAHVCGRRLSSAIMKIRVHRRPLSSHHRYTAARMEFFSTLLVLRAGVLGNVFHYYRCC